MFKFISSMTRSFLRALLGMALVSIVSLNVNAASVLATDLQALVLQANNLNTRMTGISLNAQNSCTELGDTVVSVEDFSKAVETLSTSLVAPLSMDVESLDALDSLMVTSATLAALLPPLSTDLATISSNADQVEVQAALDAMLKLSDDIGVMADRILEMADKILLMADNIGLMADRIILTQQIQSTNLALTQASILTTQQNIILLSKTVDSTLYNTALGSLINTGNVLALDFNNTPLSTVNMSSVLADYGVRVTSYLNDVMSLVTVVSANNEQASHYINSDTLTMLADLSDINAQLANAIKLYTQSVNTLAPETDIVILNAAIYSMLRLTADIGLMGNRIVEMGDDINTMADNIGDMAARIIETQTLQKSNLDLTQSNLTSAYITTVTVIADYNL